MTATPLHHVTAIAGDARRNLEFYSGTLGLRLVKRTVNYDDPSTWHLYFGDETGSPGSIITFFPWAHAAPGRLGIGETQEVMLRVPEGALGWWAHRLVERGVTHETPVRRFGETVLPLRDPDGMRLALVGVPAAGAEPAWEGGGVPADHAVRGVHGVSLLLERNAPTAAVLTDVFGYAGAGSEATTTRYRAEGARLGGIVDLREAGGFLAARTGRGSIHHIAFRAPGDEAQDAMARLLEEKHGLRPTGRKDRGYFRSIYFREPGGVLFEIATDDPGFAADEPVARLGETLKLPPQYEPARAEIERLLPELA